MFLNLGNKIDDNLKKFKLIAKTNALYTNTGQRIFE